MPFQRAFVVPGAPSVPPPPLRRPSHRHARHPPALLPPAPADATRTRAALLPRGGGARSAPTPRGTPPPSRAGPRTPPPWVQAAAAAAATPPWTAAGQPSPPPPPGGVGGDAPRGGRRGDGDDGDGGSGGKPPAILPPPGSLPTGLRRVAVAFPVAYDALVHILCALGMGVMLAAAARAAAQYFLIVVTRGDTLFCALVPVRRQFAQSLLLGLDVLLAADVAETLPRVAGLHGGSGAAASGGAGLRHVATVMALRAALTLVLEAEIQWKPHEGPSAPSF
ncbi:hypothetical protein MMPV_002905 [Pyropia vietnamensis]